MDMLSNGKFSSAGTTHSNSGTGSGGGNVNTDASKDVRIFNFRDKQSGNSKVRGTTILPIRQSTPCTIPKEHHLQQQRRRKLQYQD